MKKIINKGFNGELTEMEVNQEKIKNIRKQLENINKHLEDKNIFVWMDEVIRLLEKHGGVKKTSNKK